MNGGFGRLSKPLWLPWAILAGICSVLFLIRVTAPPDLLDAGQQKPAAYALDIVKNHQWLCQVDESGDIMSKPPLYNWLAALSSLALGRVTMLSLGVPTFLATLAIAWLIFAFGSRHWGVLAGFLGALAYLLSPATLKQVALARTDGLFSLLVMLAALAALSSWLQQRSWTWFWLAAAGATLIKGPLGVLLAAGGLLAAMWEWRSKHPSPVRGNHLWGVLVFLLLAGGWFALAYLDKGQALVDKMIGRELVGHALQDGKGHGPLEGFFKPFLYFLSRLAPWSLLACVGFWRVVRRPSADPMMRRTERFLFCWFWLGLLFFSLAAHQRADLLFPLMPAAALLAGREWARWLEPRSLRMQQAVIVGVIGLGLVAAYVNQQFLNKDGLVVRCQRVAELAKAIREKGGDEFPLTHTDTPLALQFFLNTMRLNVGATQAIELLAGEATAFVAVVATNEIIGPLQERGVAVYEVGACRFKGQQFLTLLGNRPRLELSDKLVFQDGGVRVTLEHARLTRAGGGAYAAYAESLEAAMSVANLGKTPTRVSLDMRHGERHKRDVRVLAAGETWQFKSSTAP